MQELVERNKKIKSMRFEEHMTLKEIGDIYGVTRERIRQIVGNSGSLKELIEHQKTQPETQSPE